MTKVQNEKEGSCKAFEVEIQAQKSRVEELESELKSTQETLDSKQTSLEDLDQARADLEVLRESMTKVENEKEESCKAFEVQIQAEKEKVEELEMELKLMKETLDLKQTSLEELDQARADLELLRESNESQSKRYNEVELEVERLRLEIVDLKVQQGLNDELAKEFDVLVAEFESHHNQLQQSMEEANVLRNQVEEYARTKHTLLSDLEEKNTLINSLKADLATMSKLHRNTPSSVELTEKINDLETRLMTKTDEAEDAMDRLIDQMQKNKQLSSMVENLKVKIKTKEKSANQNAKDETRQEAKQTMSFTSELESEPIPAAPPAPSPASRKRKLGYVANPCGSNKSNSISNPVNDAKENPTSASDGSQSRKTILHPKLVNQEVNQEHQRNESQPLKVKSINVVKPSMRQEEEEKEGGGGGGGGGNRRSLRGRTGSVTNPKSGSTTSAHLLASIQSLRKKQQAQAQAQANLSHQVGKLGESGSDEKSMSKVKGNHS
ncbi:hypothetical protein DFH28DRAFT_979011 [Melampsora americana]|nr:hypothetical protein DFH28DRAFT_979011 [Melampsora americana]